MRAALLTGACALLLATPAFGQAMAPMTPDPHAGHVMPAPAAPEAAVQTEPPLPPTDHAAEQFYDPAAMAAARAQLGKEHGGGRYYAVMANILEWAPGDGDAWRWEGEAWFGADINRLVIKTEGEARSGEGVEHAEVQALYARSIGPYFNLQAGVRQDIRPRPSRTYATVGIEGLAPYWFEVEGAVFLSDQGEVMARLEGSYDLRLTQKLILQPRLEANFAAQNTDELEIGSGLSDMAFGLRLRYEVRREFAPYVGVSWERKFGNTADYARAAGHETSDARLVVGLRAWF